MRASPLVALFVAGCGPATDHVRLAPTPLEPSPETTAIALYSATLPRCPVDDVGLITSQPRNFNSAATVLEGLRREARRLGGDAVVQVRFVGTRVLSGTVVRFRTPDCRQ